MARCWLLPRRARGRGRQRRDKSPSPWTQCAVVLVSSGRQNAGTRDEPAGTKHRGSCAAGAGVGAKTNTMAIVSGDSPQQGIAPGAQRSEHRWRCRCFMPAGRTQRKQSSGVAILRTHKRASAASIVPACLRCFCEWNGMERRRGRTASGARHWSRMICGSVPFASPCGMECSELKARSHAPPRQDSLRDPSGGPAQAQTRKHEHRSRSDRHTERAVCRRIVRPVAKRGPLAASGAVAGTRRSTRSETPSRAVRSARECAAARAVLTKLPRARSAEFPRRPARVNHPPTRAG